MSTNRLKNQFQWQEEIPEIGQKGDLFRDRIFVVSGKRGKIIKFSASFAYDVPEIRFEMKIVEGEKLLKQVIDLQFCYTLGATTGSLLNLDIQINPDIDNQIYYLLFANGLSRVNFQWLLPKCSEIANESLD